MNISKFGVSVLVGAFTNFSFFLFLLSSFRQYKYSTITRKNKEQKPGKVTNIYIIYMKNN